MIKKDSKLGKLLNGKVGKVVTSVVMGAASATPLAAFMPSIKAATAGIAGSDKHDPLAYAGWIAMAIALALVLTGNGHYLEAILGAAKEIKDVAE